MTAARMSPLLALPEEPARPNFHVVVAVQTGVEVAQVQDHLRLGTRAQGLLVSDSVLAALAATVDKLAAVRAQHGNARKGANMPDSAWYGAHRITPEAMADDLVAMLASHLQSVQPAPPGRDVAVWIVPRPKAGWPAAEAGLDFLLRSLPRAPLIVAAPAGVATAEETVACLAAHPERSQLWPVGAAPAAGDADALVTSWLKDAAR